MSTDFQDARLFGALEQRVKTSEARLSALESKIDANHKEIMEVILPLQRMLDQQRGGAWVLRWIGAAVVAVSGWVEFYLQRGHPGH